jgi:hypothetical protein
MAGNVVLQPPRQAAPRRAGVGAYNLAVVAEDLLLKPLIGAGIGAGIGAAVGYTSNKVKRDAVRGAVAGGIVGLAYGVWSGLVGVRAGG